MGWINSSQFVVMISILAHVTIGLSSKEQSSVQKPLPNPLIPEECFDQGYCEFVPNYPEELAAKLVAKLPKLGHMDLSLDNPSLTKIHLHSPHLESLCKVAKRNVTPKAAKDTKGRWHFILNPKNNTVQRYLETKCLANFSHPLSLQSCDNNIMYFSNTKGRCQQKKDTVVLKTIDKFGNIVHNYSFEVLCCCSCNGYIGTD